MFEFDDTVCRRVMLPRSEVVWLDSDSTFEQSHEVARHTKHTRYPVCKGSLDSIVGVVHIKDLAYAQGSDSFALADLVRPPKQVPESMPISKLLRHFQVSHQHLAFVVDEHGTVTGIVTLENVLEQIVGPVEDEFDSEEPEIVPQGTGEYLVRGSASLEAVTTKLGVALPNAEADTISGLLTDQLQRVPAVGDLVEMPGLRAEVMEVMGARATRIRLWVANAAEDGGDGKPREGQA